MALPNDISLPELCTFQDNLNSGIGTFFTYAPTGYADSLDDAINAVLSECGMYSRPAPPQSPILDVSGAVNVLGGISSAVGVLAPAMEGDAGVFLKGLIEEMGNWLPT